MQIKHMNNSKTDRSRTSPLAILLFGLGTAAALAAVAPALGETNGGPIPAGEPTAHEPNKEADADPTPVGDPTIFPPTNEADADPAPVGDPTIFPPVNGTDEDLPFDPCAVNLKSEDCNGNGVNDLCDIADGWPDADGNGVLDACQFTSGDLDLSGSIDVHDILIVLSDWGTLAEDVNGDGIVDGQDLAIILSNLSSLG